MFGRRSSRTRFLFRGLAGGFRRGGASLLGARPLHAGAHALGLLLRRGRLCRLLSRRKVEIAFADWLLTTLGVITLLNPFLYNYYNVKVGAWNNLAVGAAVFLFAIYQDWRDSDFSIGHDHHRGAH